MKKMLLVATLIVATYATIAGGAKTAGEQVLGAGMSRTEASIEAASK